SPTAVAGRSRPKPWRLRRRQLPQTESPDSAFSFDPVAAEEELSGQAHVPFAIAPVDLSVDGGQAPAAASWALSSVEHGPSGEHAFDPVSAEQDADAVREAATVTYTLDVSALERDEALGQDAGDLEPLQGGEIELLEALDAVDAAADAPTPTHVSWRDLEAERLDAPGPLDDPEEMPAQAGVADAGDGDAAPVDGLEPVAFAGNDREDEADPIESDAGAVLAVADTP
ncbi:hypothetical protein HH297_07295, partial [Xanthomonas sp. Kuri4-3]